MPRIIVSLTAIPPRFAYLEAVLRSLMQQTLRPEKILLNIPKSYRRSSFNSAAMPNILPGVTLNRPDVDYGPATKVLPAVQMYQDQEVLIFFCDDDKIYDRSTLERLTGAAQLRLGEAVCTEGSDLAEFAATKFHTKHQPRYTRKKKDALYRLKRVASFGQWKARNAKRSGYVDILEGWGGVMVRPSFFGREVFDIPDPLWMVDDIWLSGHFTARNVPIWLEAGGPRIRNSRNEVREVALRNQTADGMDRNALNLACVRHYQLKYGVWLT